MNVFRALEQNPFFNESAAVTVTLEEEPADPGQTLPEPEATHARGFVREWFDEPLIEMVPAEYRPEMQVILACNPKAMTVLRDCKLGVIDCWQALDRLRVIQ